MRFGDLLRTKRLEAGVGLRVLAREIGISHSYLIAIEQNKKPASDKVFKALISGLNIPMKVAAFYRAKLSRDASIRTVRDPGFVALVNLLADLGQESLRKVSHYVETEIK